MCSLGQSGAVWLCICFFGASVGLVDRAAAQYEQQPSAAQLTPEEERQKDIQKYDPMYREHTNLFQAGPGRDENASDSSAPNRDLQGTDAAARQDRESPRSKPLPGSIAASGQSLPANPREQVVSEDADTAAAQEYAGPAVLSRTYTLTRPAVQRQIKWSWNLGANALYGNGLYGGTANPDGSLANDASPGMSGTWAFRGRHFWKHDQIGVDYSGDYSRYSGNSSYNGQNQTLNLDFTHEFSRRLSLSFVESGSMFSQNYALENPVGSPDVSIASINLAVSPTVQILGFGTRQFNSMETLTWQKSARLSLSYGGGFFAVQQLGAGLFGTTGYQAQADINYRYTRKMTIGAYYSFSDYLYSHHIALSHSNTFGGIFSYALSKRTQIRLRGGVTRSESESLTTVPIDPVIAILIGRSSATIDSYRASLFSDVSAQLVKDFGRSRSMNIAYAHGLAPGNGLILTSVQQNISAGYSARLFHWYTATVNAGYSTLSSESQTVSKYSTEYLGFNLSRPYRHGLTTNFGADYRHFSLEGGPPTLHSQFRITTGFAWGPPEGRLW
jgi:hypothetical protein